ncbi:acyl-CoA thioesterase [Qipengyuania sp. 1NDW9]|uniref:Acyl-CoA thioesterase n=1 Tax=Qipengyuania xiapuensis TaxID=2867236 RepID=A0ABX8ZRT9_9SPHN|nr:thioesterase family protein [Qipengyuania xiapuensis]MBX7494219.1 acyl-CoA thioesterase [Qipengyuania xiapuensis]QZD91690.1 acyl-CoA thioesterase [Qipengyuania xiapuensis]
MEPFRHTFRVRYAEVDPQAVVFNSRYLEYADVLVTEFFRDARSRGMPADVEFHVRKAEVDYIAPIRLDELIEGRMTIEGIGNSSMKQVITLHGAEDDSLRAEIRLLAVHVDLPKGRPTPVPNSVRKAFGFPELENADG